MEISGESSAEVVRIESRAKSAEAEESDAGEEDEIIMVMRVGPRTFH